MSKNVEVFGLLTTQLLQQEPIVVRLVEMDSGFAAGGAESRKKGHKKLIGGQGMSLSRYGKGVQSLLADEIRRTMDLSDSGRR